tara:strand:- start:11309 stop:11968 length:660 start_codon:yes stop_codon:yes gene_type:complete
MLLFYFSCHAYGSDNNGTQPSTGLLTTTLSNNIDAEIRSHEQTLAALKSDIDGLSAKLDTLKSELASTTDTGEYNKIVGRYNAGLKKSRALISKYNDITNDVNLKRIKNPPLTIDTDNGKNYYLKLINVATGETTITMFVNGGEQISTRLPAGQYQLKYVTGDLWQGNQALFGPETSFYAGDSTINLIEDDKGSIGKIDTLKKVRNGNFTWISVSKNEW